MRAHALQWLPIACFLAAWIALSPASPAGPEEAADREEAARRAKVAATSNPGDDTGRRISAGTEAAPDDAPDVAPIRGCRAPLPGSDQLLRFSGVTIHRLPRRWIDPLRVPTGRSPRQTVSPLYPAGSLSSLERSRARLSEVARVAALGRRPLQPDWRRTPRRAVDGSIMDEPYRPFHDLTVPAAQAIVPLPAWIPDPERWEAAQEQLLAVSGCECLPLVPSPGAVPDGRFVAGTPLFAEKDPVLPDIVHLMWGSSCLAAANDYSVHEGILGSFYSHASRSCTTGGGAQFDLTPLPGSRYFLIVPVSEAAEGSYGVDHDGEPRPVSSNPCRPRRVIQPCP